MAQTITFIVPGQEQGARGVGGTRATAVLTSGHIKHSVLVGELRDGGRETRVEAVPGEDVVVLHLENGPALVLHPMNARDLFMAQSHMKRRGAEEGPGEVRVPRQLGWHGLEENIVTTRGVPRGFLGNVVLSVVQVITGVGKNAAAGLAAALAAKRIDSRNGNGVYELRADGLPTLLDANTKLANIKPAEDGRPLLVLVHGTFSSTSGTFGKLWAEHPLRVQALFSHYKNRVYALDHPTLGVSPVNNALVLAHALPKSARLHLLTHSRGGLVAEVLARACAIKDLSDEDLQAFAMLDYRDQQDELKELVGLVKQKGIQVDRVVRVACPARGTLLASQRLDAYISVFRWTLQLAGIPVLPELIDFLGEVAKHRAEPEMLPGLAAQIPDSPLVQWLHASEEAIPGQLRVVAGDIEGDTVSSWLKTLLADAYYWTDNDLVVQTRSMYGGSPRAAGATFLFDQGGKVSHFKYFSNEITAAAIADALVSDTPQDFRVIGPLSWRGESETGDRARRRAARSRDDASKPAVFLLPGILGSNLKVDGKRVWLSLRILNGLRRLKYDPRQADGVEPDGIIDSTYEDLADFLSASHQVIEFAYDWRLPIEEEARRLAGEVDAALKLREHTGQPVRLLAHSMGGLLARTMQLECPQLWERMMTRHGARFVMLGAPNGGSWAPMQVLSGDDTFGNTLIAFGAPFQDHKARDMMACFPGFIQLQAGLLDEARGLDKSQTWQALASEDLNRVREFNWWHQDERQLTPYVWGVPPQEILDRAVSLRRRLDAQIANGHAAYSEQTRLVVGRASFTPDGYEMRHEGLVYLEAQDHGDGRVTLNNALLPGVRTWVVDCEHGKLPACKQAFAAYLELLEHGETHNLEGLGVAGDTARGPLRGFESITYLRSRPSRAQHGIPPETPAEVFSPANQEVVSERAGTVGRLRVTVMNGNLMFIREPLMLGHYRASILDGAERVMDKLIRETMTRSLNVGQYPDVPGSQQVFVNTARNPENPWQVPRPEAVIVVGLGEEGKLRSSDLVRTVKQGTIAWARRVAETCGENQQPIKLAATLISSGGTGISAGQAARLVAMGVQEANEALAQQGWLCVQHLLLIELYLDRATEAWSALQSLAEARADAFDIAARIETGTGPLRRPLESNYRGAAYDLIRAETQPDGRGDSLITYTLDSRRARSEVRAHAAQGSLVRDMVSSASNDLNGDVQIGHTLFKLLIPVEMEAYMAGMTEMQLELDSTTAGIPWELLDTTSGTDDKRKDVPWAIRSKLLRRMRTGSFRAAVKDVDREGHVLVIGEPKCDKENYPPLPGARDEAKAVAARLRRPGVLAGDAVKSLIRSDNPADEGPDTLTIINALLERPWRIIHIAGHGEPSEMIGAVPKKPGDPPQKEGPPRGVVLSNGTFLGPKEINIMRDVPELVFVNCCHQAVRDSSSVLRQPERAYDRPHFAANVAEALIGIGVRCVIAAGWAVDDHAAKVFATAFYDALLAGERFIDAVARAREAAWQCGGSTWAAYQCYGDPAWTFQPGPAAARSPSLPLSEQYALIASAPALILTLEALIVSHRFKKPERDDTIEKISYLEVRFAPQWGGIGTVAEAFGVAWAEVGELAKAIDWYKRAMAANDGSASLKVCEQLGNLRARLAWESVARLDMDHVDASGNDGDRPREKNNGAVYQALTMAEAELKEAISLLESLVALQPTLERESLCGSAYKRLAMVKALGGRTADELQALRQMKDHYGKAEELARATGHPELFYPALNRIAGELVTNIGSARQKGLDPGQVEAARKSILDRLNSDPDFWSMAAGIDLRLYEALAAGNLKSEVAQIEREYEDLHMRTPASSMWTSVRHQGEFVLRKYISRVSGDERIAVERLLACMAQWSGVTNAAMRSNGNGSVQAPLKDPLAHGGSSKDANKGRRSRPPSVAQGAATAVKRVRSNRTDKVR